MTGPARTDARVNQRNCPLVTGLRPCLCDLPRCPRCGYTEHDARFENDHFRCPGEIPKRGEAPDA